MWQKFYREILQWRGCQFNNRLFMKICLLMFRMLRSYWTVTEWLAIIVVIVFLSPCGFCNWQSFAFLVVLSAITTSLQLPHNSHSGFTAYNQYNFFIFYTKCYYKMSVVQYDSQTDMLCVVTCSCGWSFVYIYLLIRPFMQT